MKTVHLIKQLNNTELGKGGTNDTYVFVQNDLDISDIFEEPNKVYDFIDIETSEVVHVRHTIGREKRIVGLGQYYRNNNLSAGDSVVFGKTSTENSVAYTISVIKLSSSIVFQKIKDGFEVLTPERIELANEWGKNSTPTLAVAFQKSIKKRNDSPIETDIYDITIEGETIIDRFNSNEMGIIDIFGSDVVVKKSFGWKLLQTEEQ